MNTIYICCVVIIALISVILLKNGKYKILNTIILGIVSCLYNRDDFEISYVQLTGDTTNIHESSRRYLDDTYKMAETSKFIYI